MALSSPGVEVQVIDESFYTPAAPGTVPMIFVASASNKTNGSGTGTAPGTLQQNAGVPYLLTSQRELAETFGDPVFYTDANNNPVHGGELNEYGLQAAYSMLGVSNRAYVVRADLDLAKLVPQADEPAGNPAGGTYWLDTSITTWGISEWNGADASTSGGQTFSPKTPLVVAATDNSAGNRGDYAVITDDNTPVELYYKAVVGPYKGTWVKLGSDEWKQSWPTARSLTGPSVTNQDFAINSNVITVPTGATLASIATEINNTFDVAGTISAEVVNGALEIYSSVDVTITDGTFDPGGSSTAGPTQNLFGVASGTEFKAPVLQMSAHTDVPAFSARTGDDLPTGSVWVKTTEPNAGARWRVKRFNSETELFDAVDAPIYSGTSAALRALDTAGGGINIPVGDTFVEYNSAQDGTAEFVIYRRGTAGVSSTASTATTDVAVAGDQTITITETRAGLPDKSTDITIIGNDLDAALAVQLGVIADAINTSSVENISAVVSNGVLTISHAQGGEIFFEDSADDVLAAFGISDASNWEALSFVSSADAPTSGTADGELWYSSVVDEADIMIHNGTTWVGYQNYTGFSGTNASGPFVQATQPTAEADGDLWIDTSDLENYPVIYQWNEAGVRWDLRDNTDQTTSEGVLFADARWSTSGDATTSASITALLTSDFLDPDAPDPALYPEGMLLFNTRRSGFNVKRYVANYIDVESDNARFNDEAMSGYNADRWVTESANQGDGSGSFGSKAQRKVVVQALQAMVNSNDAIRDDESRIFNLMATPGYPELIGEMITLNYDRNLSAFVVGDTPATLTPDATSLNEWGTNIRNAVEDNENGLVSFDEYLGVYYPWGFTSDNFGNNVVVPPSHMMLRTIALNDQVAFPWFAPAGTRRGGITNATATGYIDSEGEFNSIALNEGQRDTLYGIAVNPVTFLSGSGLVAFGQKTRARNASALDRINVARLVIFLRGQLKRLAKPYLFEPNDKITRDQIKAAAESIMLELVGQRALNDFLVVCDETNNTPARIDRNELYLDIAIEPVKAVEFIYIPLRLKNTGEIAGL